MIQRTQNNKPKNQNKIKIQKYSNSNLAKYNSWIVTIESVVKEREARERWRKIDFQRRKKLIW